MAYCRFSSDDFKSDVYVYYGENGFNIYVSSRRLDIEDVGPKVDLADTKAFVARHKRLMEAAAKADSKPIEHPDAGECFVFHTPMQAMNKLLELKDAGFRIPDAAIAGLKAEVAEWIEVLDPRSGECARNAETPE